MNLSFTEKNRCQSERKPTLSLASLFRPTVRPLIETKPSTFYKLVQPNYSGMEMMTEEMKTPRVLIESAITQLDSAAEFAELAAQSLSRVEGLTEQWERVRALYFSISDERNRLWDLLDSWSLA